MDWFSKNNEDTNSFPGSIGKFQRGNGGGGSRRVVRSQCRTEEVEPGRFVRKCEKTEQIFKDCAGRPSEMVGSTTEHTEEDVTNEMVNQSPSVDSMPLFPGLHSDIQAIEREFFGGINELFKAAEAMTDEFFNSVSVPRIYDDGSHRRQGIHIEDAPSREALPEKKPDGEFDLSQLARDV